MDFRINIEALGKAVPGRSWSTADVVAAFADEISLPLKKTLLSLGVEGRHSVIRDFPDYVTGKVQFSLHSTAASLGVTAVREMIALSPLPYFRERVGLFVGVTNTAGKLLPAMGHEIHARLADVLSRSVSIVCLQGQGCSAMLKALEMTQWYLQANPTKKAMIVVSEANTAYATPKPLGRADGYGPYLGFNEIKACNADAPTLRKMAEDTQQVIQSALFGDGAIALLVGAGEGAVTLGPFTHLSNEQLADVDLLTINKGGSDQPAVLGKPDYHMMIEVPVRGAHYAERTVESLFEMIGIGDRGALERYLIHTGGKKILDAVCSALGIGKGSDRAAASYDILKRYGNISSPSLGFMLAENKSTGTGVMVGFGVGFSASACAVEWA